MVDITERLRKQTGKKTGKMPQLVTNIVAYLKQAEAYQLQAGLDTQDGHQAEVHRAMAIALDYATKVVLQSFDEISRKPTL